MRRALPSAEFLGAGGFLLILLLALFLRVESEPVGAAVPEPMREAALEPAEVALAPGQPAAADAGEAPAVERPVGHRVAVAVDAPDTPEPEDRAALQGFVLDAEGRPLANTVLSYRRGALDAIRFESGAGRRIGSVMVQPAKEVQFVTRTNAHGEFVFDEPNRKDGGTILFQPAEYVEGAVASPVDRDSDWQSLQSIPAPHQDSSVRFWITGIDSLRPIEVDSVQVSHVAGSFEFPRRLPREGERTIEKGEKATEVVQRGMAPGVWRFTFGLRHGIPQRVDVHIEKPGSERELTVLVESWPDANATEIGFKAEPDGSLPWVDASTGLQDWLPRGRIRIGEHKHDRHFAQTLRLGHGGVEAAELTLLLRPINGMSRNDAIYLEHRGQHGFAWKSRLADLFGGRWQGTEARTLHLDLARLPLQEDETFDLRPYLEDGLLDLVIQDDTAIEQVKIRIVR